jgi:hypothetical protein
MKRIELALFMVTLFCVPAAGQTQPKSCSNSASGVFTVLLMAAKQTPVHSETDFAPIQKLLDFYCFARETQGWSYSGSSAKVMIVVYPNDGVVSLLLLPHTPQPFGDAAVAALIARAATVEADGDGINIDLPTRKVVAKSGEMGTITDSFAFNLNHGTWFRTASTIEWSR